MIENLLGFIVATSLLALSPGPDNIYVLTQSLANGSKSGIATTAGLISGCIVHTSLLAFGVSALIAASTITLWIIKIGGAMYLLYLAYKVYTTPATITIASEVPTKSLWELFRIGVFMNLVNPKVLLFFLAFFPSFLWNPTADTIFQFYVLGLVFMTVSFFIFSSIAMLAGKLSGVLHHSSTTHEVLKWVQIIVFVGIAIFILL